MPVMNVSAGRGVAFLIGVTAMSDIIAKACSSPQTVHVNPKRADTLMTWVRVGLIEGSAVVAIAALIDKQYAWAIVAGGALEAAITYYEYAYAKKSSQESDEPPTENYGTENNPDALYQYSQA